MFTLDYKSDLICDKSRNISPIEEAHAAAGEGCPYQVGLNPILMGGDNLHSSDLHRKMYQCHKNRIGQHELLSQVVRSVVLSRCLLFYLFYEASSSMGDTGQVCNSL